MEYKHGYRGIRYKPGKRRWAAEITVDSRRIHLGSSFLTRDEALMAVKAGELKYGLTPVENCV